MSTKQRYGDAVWNALVAVFNDPNTPDDAYVSVGEVAIKAGVSRPTAKKYLEELRGMGNAKRVCVGMRRG